MVMKMIKFPFKLSFFLIKLSFRIALALLILPFGASASSAFTGVFSSSSADGPRVDSNGYYVIKRFKTDVGNVYASLVEDKFGNAYLTDWTERPVAKYYNDGSNQTHNYRTGELQYGDHILDELPNLRKESRGY